MPTSTRVWLSFSERFEMPKEFVIPGQTVVAAHLDHARTVVRRAERLAMRVAGDGSHVVPYLNRLSDLLWTLARWAEGGSLAARATSGPTDAPTSGPGGGGGSDDSGGSSGSSRSGRSGGWSADVSSGSDPGHD